LNAQRRLVFYNTGCERLTGWEPADVLGQVCDFVTEADSGQSAAILANLAAPADVWNGRTASVPASVAARNGDPVSCVIQFFPLSDGEQKVQAVLGVIQPLMTQTPTATVSERLHAELAKLRQSIRQQFSNSSMVAKSAAMRRVLGQLQTAQQATLPVLFVGETGTGREQMARLIHDAGEYPNRAFVPLDCQKLSADHLEAALLRLSDAEHAGPSQPGTIHLKHVDLLPRDLQQLILKLIDKKSRQPLRFLASSTRRLESLLEADEILNDFYFALTALVIDVPALRDRMDDLEPLAQFFLEEMNRGDQRQINGFDSEVWQQFQRYNWPGNVDELRAVVIEARNACDGSLIETGHLPFRFRAGVDGQAVGPTVRKRTVPLDPLLLQVEREQIEIALTEAKQNKAKAAELLGITRPRLYRRMELLGIIDNEELDADQSAQ